MAEYLKEKFDFNEPEFVAAFDEVPYWSAKFGMLLLDNLERAGNLNILDLGCGTGFPLFEMARLFGSSCQFTGADVWQTALERATFKLKKYGLDNVKLVKLEGEGTSFPLPDAHFDLIVSNLGINNFARPAATLAECARVAKIGARLALTTNLKGNFQEFYAVYRQILTEMAKPAYLERLAANEDHRGTPASVSALLEQASFSVTKVVEDDFQMRFVDGSALLRHFLVKIGFLDSWRSVVDKQDEEAVFAKLETRLNEMARIHGELRMTVPMLYLEAKKQLTIK